MSKDKDQTRETIEAKIATKTVAREKLTGKLDTLNETEVVYLNAITKAENKIFTLRQKIKGFAASRATIAEDKAKRETELVKMNEILQKYDDLMAEGESLQGLLLAKIKEHEWYPGDPAENRGSLERDAEYMKARKRKLEINDWTSEVLGDINRIFYSRGEVD